MASWWATVPAGPPCFSRGTARRSLDGGDVPETAFGEADARRRGGLPGMNGWTWMRWQLGMRGGPSNGVCALTGQPGWRRCEGSWQGVQVAVVDGEMGPFIGPCAVRLLAHLASAVRRDCDDGRREVVLGAFAVKGGTRPAQRLA